MNVRYAVARAYLAWQGVVGQLPGFVFGAAFGWAIAWFVVGMGWHP